jgi:hypothetical protein
LDLQELIEELKSAEDMLNAISYESGQYSAYNIQLRTVNRLTAMVEEAQKESVN